MDKIFIRNLRCQTIVGTLPQERNTPREVVFQLELQLNLAKAGQSDNLFDTVNYQAVAEEVRALCQKSNFMLVEALAEAVAQTVLRHEGVAAVTLTLDKPGAIEQADSVAVEIHRVRGA